MTITLNGTTGITNDGGYTGDGVVFADATPSNTLVTTTVGNVGIGTSATASGGGVHKLVISAANGGFQVNSTVQTAGFAMTSAVSGGGLSIYTYTGAIGSETYTERMIIDSSGNLLVGTTSAGGRITSRAATSNSSSWSLHTENSGGTGQFRVRGDGALYMGLDTVSPYNITTGSAANAFLGGDGFLYRSTSSLKYKTDVKDAEHGLADLLKLRSVTYKSNRQDASGSVPETVYGGLIAEEVHEAGLTEFVQYAEDGTPDALSYGNMVSLCVKAIQEQQAIITDLKARIETLENK